MDVELLSRMIGELVLDHNSLSVPGLGTFVAEDMPASFSERGYTINPPYRRLSFSGRESSDGLLAELYAAGNGLEPDEAAAILETFIVELKSALQKDKTVELPGLGRLRATRENSFFFVPNEDLDISPDTYGLDPVSLKSHGLIGLPEIPVRPEPDTAEPEPANEAEPAPTESEPADQSEPASAESEPALAEPVSATPEPVSVEQEPAVAGPEPEPELEPAPEPAPEPTPEPTTEPEPAPEPTPEPAPTPEPRPRKRRKGLGWAIGTVAAAAALLLAFVLASRLAPGSTDPLLYTQEELAIINHPEDGSGLPR